MPRWLLCPQCGAPLFFVEGEGGFRMYFHVDPSREVLPTKPEYEPARELAGAGIRCTSCSWRGAVARLLARL